MASLRFDLVDDQPGYLEQVRYALAFASEDVESFSIAEGALEVQLREGTAPGEAKAKIERLLARYADRTFGLKEVVHFEQRRELPRIDAYAQLVERRLVTPVGPGHVVLRGLAARLQRTVDAKVLAEVAAAFEAEEEVYPATIQCSTLDRLSHFTSFPEHVDFVSHLRGDVEVLGRFADACREGGWSPEHHQDAMAPVEFAICPSCCYHCYEAMEGWTLERPGRCVTSVVACHRYEAGNLTTLSRLRAFHMREVVWVGHPLWVKESRQQADDMLVQWARDWQLDCTLENANDMFFTDDYAVKASFQRQQQAKRELRLRIPFEERAISCSSSNFHSATFGRAFGITCGGRPATSACLGWGHERWVYAVFSQLGLDPSAWPEKLQEDLRRYAPP